MGINLARIFKLMMLNGRTKNTKYACCMQATVSSCCPDWNVPRHWQQQQQQQKQHRQQQQQQQLEQQQHGDIHKLNLSKRTKAKPQVYYWEREERRGGGRATGLVGFGAGQGRRLMQRG